MLGFTETVLRDANQSLAATRMKQEDFEGILEMIDKAGYYSVECWGGATFDSCIRYLNEDPWERLRFIKKKLPNTKLQMLLRGQNLLGYTHYPTQMVRDFVRASIENGIDIIRIFDALNDLDNIKDAVKATLDFGGHPSCAISYTTSPVHSVDNFVRLAVEMEKIGAQSICIKDMSGCLMPDIAYQLVSELKRNIHVPIILHSHCSTGVAQMTYLKAIEAGVDVIDTSVSSFSGGTSQPATETMALVAKNYGINISLDVSCVNEINKHFKKVFDRMMSNKTIFYNSMQTDPNGLIYQVPGGMYSNLLSQLKSQGLMDRMNEVLAEVPRVREDLGFPPLVTPISQMVGTQATINVINGERYKVVIKEVKAYLRGEYGKAPGIINDQFKRAILGTSDTQPIHIKDDYLSQKENLARQGYCIEDILTLVMFPQIAEEFLRMRTCNMDNVFSYSCCIYQEKQSDCLKQLETYELNDDLLAVFTAIIASYSKVTPDCIAILNVYEEK